MSTYLVTHIDLDGAGVAVLAKRFFSSSLASVSFQDYDTIDKYLAELLKIVEKDDEIIIADVSPGKATCEWLDTQVKKGMRIRLFDHHSSRHWVTQYSWVTFNENKCGTTLIYEYFSELQSEKIVEYSRFAKAIEAYDIWLINSSFRRYGKDLHTLYTFTGAEDFISLFTLNPEADSELRQTIKYAEKRKDKIITKTLENTLGKTLVRIDALGRQFIIIHATDYISEISDAILTHESYNDLSYVIVYNPALESCSLRSQKDVGVTTIAKKLGGGGHKNAAGFYYRTKENNELAIFKMVNALDFSQNT